MATRRFFTKAVAPVPKPPKVRRPVHKGKNVLVEVKPGIWRLMKSSEYAMQIGRSKGGLTAQARGTAYKWDSEAATNAIKKCWKTRWSKGRRIGVRLGRPAKLRQKIDRQSLRDSYSWTSGVAEQTTPRNNRIWYDPRVKAWYCIPAVMATNTFGRLISETQALRRLGHLAGMHKSVPVGQAIPVNPPTKGTK